MYATGLSCICLPVYEKISGYINKFNIFLSIKLCISDDRFAESQQGYHRNGYGGAILTKEALHFKIITVCR